MASSVAARTRSQPTQQSPFRYLAEGGRWHDDDTAEAFEPNGAGGHNAVIHT